jgi:hypothetical protein
MSWGLDLETGEETVEVFDGHTYNLTPMWRLAGVFNTSRDLDGERARAIHSRAVEGLTRAVSFPDQFRSLNPANGWGDYEGFVEMLTLLAIRTAEHPNAVVRWNG